jgi:hypothetical protein
MSLASASRGVNRWTTTPPSAVLGPMKAIAFTGTGSLDELGFGLQKESLPFNDPARRRLTS